MAMDQDRYRGLLDDLRAEGDELTSVLAALAEAQWSLDTPAQGWTVHDQLEHLAFFDDMARLALMHPDEFDRRAREVTAVGRDWVDRISFDRRAGASVELLLRFERSRAALMSAFTDAEPDRRAPWFGPTMSAASSASARMMETWAHSQDVHDALAIKRLPSERIRHVCHLGVITRDFSFRINGFEPPASDVRVELVSPAGKVWNWGAQDAVDRVTGDAWDFALVVTQRRALADTTLQSTAGAAAQWLLVAQAFAGDATARRSGAKE
jgi:uncharacterized protein (TIGR03084 family)